MRVMHGSVADRAFDVSLENQAFLRSSILMKIGLRELLAISSATHPSEAWLLGKTKYAVRYVHAAAAQLQALWNAIASGEIDPGTGTGTGYCNATTSVNKIALSAKRVLHCTAHRRSAAKTDNNFSTNSNSNFTLLNLLAVIARVREGLPLPPSCPISAAVIHACSNRAVLIGVLTRWDITLTLTLILTLTSTLTSTLTLTLTLTLTSTLTLTLTSLRDLLRLAVLDKSPAGSFTSLLHTCTHSNGADVCTPSDIEPDLDFSKLLTAVSAMLISTQFNLRMQLRHIYSPEDIALVVQCRCGLGVNHTPRVADTLTFDTIKRACSTVYRKSVLTSAAQEQSDRNADEVDILTLTLTSTLNSTLTLTSTPTLTLTLTLTPTVKFHDNAALLDQRLEFVRISLVAFHLWQNILAEVPIAY